MKNLLLILFTAVVAFGCKEKAEKKQAETEAEVVAETEVEKPVQEWTVLFDGSSFDGWKEYNKEGVSENWKLEDGAMVFYPPKDRKKGEAFNLVTEKEYTDFVLSLEWKISEGGNSGVFWGVSENPELSEAYQTGPEVQVLDNEKHPDAKNGTTHQAGSLYDMVAPSEDVTNAVGEWNTMVITINHKEEKGSIAMNGKLIVEFPVGNEMWKEMVSKSKFADWEYFGKFTTGKIGLQDHGDQVAFRNIKIREL
ncbi:protein of unknown function [Zobellia uliginosa]|uniref:3-keto-alpha-glucoside-1,2-lyase/3-keto-2-hydroxy-glucal hydratase domain-containing protein n=1 Tax=Zobellia uliginosa TaxID=143224 RepID=A0ABY1KHT3_9FLAO|nr:DUF1080 domain-containing protein [Zobellia uliginosa]SIS37310.1 protein of unknown function [Zobellia uliginosa]